MKKLLKISAFLIAVIITISATALQSNAAQVKGTLGDTNGDGKVTIVDATLIQKNIAKLRALDDASISRARVCGYSRLSILDATAIQRYLAGFTTDFPANAAEEEVSKVKDNITIYFTNNKKWDKVSARFLNRVSGESADADLKNIKDNENGEQVYSAEVDLSKYDRVIFGNGVVETTLTPVTKASSGFYIRSGGTDKKVLAGVYTYGTESVGNLDYVMMDYPDGYQKKVYIHTPAGYDPADKSKKYSVLYMSDGHAIFGKTPSDFTSHEWRCDETVDSLVKNGGDGVIVVGVVTNGSRRFNELTPKIAENATGVPKEYYFEDMSLEGELFSDFIINTVIPYVEGNYNTNSIRGFAGSSNGGLEAFYIGLEHPDMFKYIGALSPSFDFFDMKDWDKYLAGKDYSGKMPKIYISNGNNERDFVEQTQYKSASIMESHLTKAGFPDDKVVTVLDEEAMHSEDFWAIYFPEMLSWGLGL